MQRVTLPRVGVVTFVLCEHGPQHAGVLVGNRNQRLVIPLAFMELPDPSLQAAGVRGVGTQRRLQRTSDALNEQRAQVDVAAQADMSEPRPPELLPSVLEDPRIGHRGGQCAGGERTDAEQFAGACCNVTASACVAICWSQRASRRFSAASCSRTSSSIARTGSGSLVSSISMGNAMAPHVIVIPGGRSKPERGQVAGGKDGQCVARRADRHELP
jgi:hypothetical protein